MEADQETLEVTALPFVLTSIAATYQDALRGKFINQVGHIYPLADQLSPTVNMLQIGRRPKASLQTILEENLDSESQGSTKNDTMTTAAMTTGRRARGPGDFIDADQMF